MKLFYSLLLICSLFCISSSAQSLTPGQVTDNVYNKALLAQRFSIVNNDKSTAQRVSFTETSVSGNEAAGTPAQKEINFTISYNYELNTLTGATDCNNGKGNSTGSFAVKPSSRFTDPSAAELKSINFMQLKLSLGSSNAAVTVSNLQLNGMNITGSYTADSEGDIYWYMVYKDFGADFTVTGTINTDGNLSAANAINNVEFNFGSSSSLSASPLSVYWGDINTDQKNNGNVINWDTNKEENNDRFIIERATDGISFTGIGLVNGAGNRTTRSSYIFTDTTFTEGTNYYRIKQVDMEGHASYSVVVHTINNTTISQQSNNTTVETSTGFNKNTRAGSMTNATGRGVSAEVIK